MPIVRHEPFEPTNQRRYEGQRLGIQVDENTVVPIPGPCYPQVLVGSRSDLRIMDVTPISRLPIVVMDHD